MIEAEIIAIGSELLTPFRADTNSLYLTRTLEECGIRVVAKTIVGDELEDLVFAFRTAFERADLVLCSGGLGPTADDLTREALSTFLAIPLHFYPEILAGIEARFKHYNLRMPSINRNQAMVPEGGQWLENHHGTAPGIYLETKGKQVFLLPGPPFELEPMWEKYGLPLLKKEEPFLRCVFRIAMMGESMVDEMLKPITGLLRDVRYTILASPSEIEIHLLSPEHAADELISAAAEIRSVLGNRIFTEEKESLEAVVGRLLTNQKKTVSVAESCTGGLLAERFTNIPGSSAYFERGVVTYSNESKTQLLGVPKSLIEEHGAVSEAVAGAMAESIRDLAGTDYGIAITGIAGPEGATSEKPLGTVFVGISGPGWTEVQRFHLVGGRQRVRFSSTQAALNLLRLKLL